MIYIKKIFILISLICVIAIISITAYEILLHRILSDYAENSGKSYLIHIANTASQTVFSNRKEDIGNITRKSDNSVTSMQIDIYTLNEIKSELNGEIYRLISEEKDMYISIPIGNLIGTNLTNGYGPDINFKIRFVPTVTSEFSSRFISSGINQTLHEIILTVNIDGYAILSLNRVSFSAATSYIVSQTLINGNVPDSYTNIDEGANKETVDNIVDFSR